MTPRITAVSAVSPGPPGVAVQASRAGGAGRTGGAGGAGRGLLCLEVDVLCPQVVDLHLVGDERS
ncbi:hypothetical protein ABT173_30940 [Streptomyces sp. NPDC001795]|uniref:hypothetical protein n=1 Tax=unclassified Streptomyces TaxID=2593676 RepID=UPI00332A6A2F